MLFEPLLITQRLTFLILVSNITLKILPMLYTVHNLIYFFHEIGIKWMTQSSKILGHFLASYRNGTQSQNDPILSTSLTENEVWFVNISSTTEEVIKMHFFTIFPFFFNPIRLRENRKKIQFCNNSLIK